MKRTEKWAEAAIVVFVAEPVAMELDEPLVEGALPALAVVSVVVVLKEELYPEMILWSGRLHHQNKMLTWYRPGKNRKKRLQLSSKKRTPFTGSSSNYIAKTSIRQYSL